MKEDLFPFPLVSVVIPTYNHAFFLKKAISSVIGQTFKNFELIIVDNKSTDETDEVIKSFTDPRIKVLKVENNGIIGLSRNFGIENSKGNWIAFLDSDDYWYEDRLEKIFFKSKNFTQYDVISTNEISYNEITGKKKKLYYGPLKDGDYRSLLLYGNRLSPSGTVVSKKFLQNQNLKFNEEEKFITVEDYDLWLNLSFNKAKFKFIKEVLGVYTIHESNNSKRNNLHKKNEINLYKKHIFEVQAFEQNKKKLWKNIKSVLKVKKALYFFKEREYITSLGFFTFGFFKSPIFIMKYLFMKILFLTRNIL
tara:strand:- start:821 stop:1744 length:924 start_codon:yes stop_codon:yes gene_type:complete